MHGNRMSIGDFYDLSLFNCFSYFNRLGPISGLNRHQRHQNDPLHLPALLWCLRVVVQSQSKENPLQLEIDADITEETARHENRFRIRDDTPGICRRERQLLTVTKLAFQPSKIMIV